MRSSILWISFLLAACGRDQRDAPVIKIVSAGGMHDGSGSSAGGTNLGAALSDGSGGERSEPSNGGSSGEGGGSSAARPLTRPILLEHVTLPDGSSASLLIDGESATNYGEDSPRPESIVDVTGLHLVPGFVDSHVHLTYFPQAEGLASFGILAAVDLAAPVESLRSLPTALHLLPAGPMITSVGGYPTQSWGSNGYGLEVTSVDEARAAVGSLAQAGARVIKVPLDGDNSPSDDQVRAVTEAAHQLDLKVAAHALTLAGVERMVTLGCDILAHAPTENLPDATVAAFGRRAVVSTLGAFGAARTAKDNLARLHAAGATVLYGTDFGNSRIVGIDVQELALLEEIGLTRDEVLDAATTLPADYWGITEGTFNLGGDASFLLLTGDPREDFSVLSSPVYTFFRGQMLRGPSDD